MQRRVSPAAGSLMADSAEIGPVGARAGTVSLPAWLTVEAVLWAAILGVAGGLRWVGLGEPPLGREEAALAAAAMDVIKGRPVDLSHGSLPVYGTAAVLFALGANDLAARLLPMVAGLLVVAWPIAARGLLGVRVALVSALLLATSPTLVHASRTVGGETIALATGLYALLALVRMAQGGGRRYALVAGALAALFLASGTAAHALLVPSGIAAGVALLRARQAPWLRVGREEWRALLIAGGGALALVATGLFSNPLGVQEGVIDAVAAWGGAVFSGQGDWGAGFYLVSLVSYELPLLSLAILGLALRGDRPQARFPWVLFTVALAVSLITRPYTPGTQLVIVVPLAIAGGLGGAAVWEGIERRQAFGEACLFAVATLPLLALWVLTAGYLSLPAPVVPPAFLLGPLFLLAFVSLAWAYLRGVRVAGSGLGLLAVVVAVLFAFHSASGVATAGDKPLPLLRAETPSLHLRALLDELEGNVAVYGTAGYRDLPVAVDEELRYPFRWYLRDYSRVAYGPYDGRPLAVIRGEGSPAPAGDYRYKTYVLSTMAFVPGPDFGALWRWLYYREPAWALERESVRLYFVTRP